jgi:hypothetical protein
MCPSGVKYKKGLSLEYLEKRQQEAQAIASALAAAALPVAG